MAAQAETGRHVPPGRASDTVSEGQGIAAAASTPIAPEAGANRDLSRDGRLRAAAPTPARRIVFRFRRHTPAMIGCVVLTVLVIAAIIAPVLAPHDPYVIDLSAYRQAPSADHLLGTDTVGRDVLSRLIYGARISLSVGLVAVSISVLIGTVVGAVSGFYRGFADALLMRLTDTVLCFPSLIIILVVVAVIGPSIFNVMLAIGLLHWTGIARLIRGQVLSIREREFVEAARCIGATNTRIVFRHVLPEVVGPITVAATFGMATAILMEAGLSFLGLGVQPPTASWGNMLTDAQSLTILETSAWLWLPPGTMILITVLAINFVGDGLHDAFDPRQVGG